MSRIWTPNELLNHTLIGRNVRIDITRTALNNGADPNYRNENGRTMLEEAFLNQRMDQITLLLDRGASPNIIFSSGETPLMVALGQYNTPLLRLLLEKGVDVNMASNGKLPIIDCMTSEDYDTANLLIDSGANLLNIDASGQSGLSKIVEMDSDLDRKKEMLDNFLSNVGWQNLCDIISNLGIKHIRTLIKERSAELAPLFNFKGFFDKHIDNMSKEDLCKVLTKYYILPTCSNDIDTITQDEFGSSVIYLGNPPFRQCYNLDSLYDYYVSTVESNQPFRDPNTRAKPTLEEQTELIRRIKLKRPGVVLPVLPAPPPGNIVNLVIELVNYLININEQLISYPFFHILLTEPTGVITDLGYIPDGIDENATQSTNLTSAVVIANIHALWSINRLLTSLTPVTCCSVHLRKPVQYWITPDGTIDLERFIAMAREIEDIL